MLIGTKHVKWKDVMVKKQSEISTSGLKSFIAVVDSGSVYAAAEERGASQSTVWYQIKNLESYLQCELFRKEGKALKPTFSGKLFYKHAKSLLVQVENARIELDANMRVEIDLIFENFIPAKSMRSFVSVCGDLFPDYRLNIISNHSGKLKGNSRNKIFVHFGHNASEAVEDIEFILSKNIEFCWACLPEDNSLLVDSVSLITHLNNQEINDSSIELTREWQVDTLIAASGSDINSIVQLVGMRRGIGFLPLEDLASLGLEIVAFPKSKVLSEHKMNCVFAGELFKNKKNLLAQSFNF